MSQNPYSQYPERSFWRKTVSHVPWTKVFEHEKGKFSLKPGDKIATAVSCFAQRIPGVLRESGFNFAEFEAPHPLMSAQRAAEYGYGQFSARYGNIYTPRQLRQLIDQAFGVIAPVFDFAPSFNGGLIDLLRPNINKHGFSSELEARLDREYHLGRVKELFATSDVFIFTLGLTESWMGETSGTVYGSHPHVVSNAALRENIIPVNFDYTDSFNDMVYIINFLHEINPALKYIFTVSPVALIATHQNNNVLLSTMYSKSVLRAVAGKLAEAWPAADYFFSYEIFNAAQSFGQFLADDLRDVNQRGVAFTMQCFKQMYLTEAPLPAAETAAAAAPAESSASLMGRDQAAAEVECDERLNELFSRPGTGT